MRLGDRLRRLDERVLGDPGLEPPPRVLAAPREPDASYAGSNGDRSAGRDQSLRATWKRLLDSDGMGGGQWLRAFLVAHTAFVLGLHGVFTLPTKRESFAVFVFGAVTTPLFWWVAVRQWRRLRGQSSSGPSPRRG